MFDQDSIKVHLKGGKGPITVLTCEIGTEGGEKGGCFLTLEESRVNTAPLHTGNHDDNNKGPKGFQLKRVSSVEGEKV